MTTGTHDTTPRPENRLGLVVNPVAGIGGPAGLRGSDGDEVQRLARSRGSRPASPGRARLALAVLADRAPGATVVTGDGPLGADLARAAGLGVEIVHTPGRGTPEPGACATTALDTRATVAGILRSGADVLLVAGGDGTARDVAATYADAADPGTVPVVGVPGGVKMHSGVFARSPRAAGHLAADVLAGLAAGRPLPAHPVEIVDHDEDARRRGVLSTTLYGYLPAPGRHASLQGGKVGSGSSAGATEQGTAGLDAECARRMANHDLWVLGPGSTVAAVAHTLRLDSTLLGVDVVDDGRIVGRDVDAARLAELTAGRRPRVLLSPVGGQGMLLGRGNQQLDAVFLARLSRADLLVAATAQKLAALAGGPLWVDVPEGDVETRLAGYHRVVTGWDQDVVVEVRGANETGSREAGDDAGVA